MQWANNDKQNELSMFWRKDCSNKFARACKETSPAVIFSIYYMQSNIGLSTLFNTNIYLLFPAPGKNIRKKRKLAIFSKAQVATHHLFHEEWKHNALELGHVDDLCFRNLGVDSQLPNQSPTETTWGSQAAISHTDPSIFRPDDVGDRRWCLFMLRPPKRWLKQVFFHLTNV